MSRTPARSMLPTSASKRIRLMAAILVAACLAACADGNTGPQVSSASGDSVSDDEAASVAADEASSVPADEISAVATDAVVELDDVTAPQLPVTVTSADGQEVTITDASRILPLVGSVAEVVFSLGLGEAVIGRDVSATFEQAKDLPVVTEGHEISVEGVLSLRPSVILADTWAGPPEAIEQLRASGIPVVIFEETWSLEGIPHRIRDVAAALGVADTGERLIERTEQNIERAAATVPEATEPLRVAFLYLRGTAGVYLLGGPGSGADALLERLGAEDAGTAIGLDRSFTPITSEALIDAQPDVILVMTSGLESVGGPDGLAQIPGIAQTPAGRNQRFVDVDDDLLLSFGPRTGYVLEHLARDLYATDLQTADD